MNASIFRNRIAAARCVIPCAAILLCAATASALPCALLMSGFTDGGFQEDLSHVYVTLLEDGYIAENIFVLYHQGEDLDLNGDTINDVDMSCYKPDIAAAFDSIAARIGPWSPVFFFATGHGTSQNRSGHGYPNSRVLTVSYADTLWDFELTQHLKNVESAVGSSVRKICLIVPCRSGGFFSDFDGEADDLNDLEDISVASSVKYFQDATYYNYGYKMTYWWTSALRNQDWDGAAVNADHNADGSVSLREAFRFAKSKSEERTEVPDYFAESCFLDHFTGLNGMLLPVPFPVINIVCCPPSGPPPWYPYDCGGTGLNVTGTVGKRGTMEATARLANLGTVSSPAAMLHYYYRVPTLGLGFYDTGWQWVDTRTVPPLAPGDTTELAPSMFTVPDLNPFGEPYWTYAARIDDPANPPESGWVGDDPQVKMVNQWLLDGAPGVLHEVHFYAVNPTGDTAQVVLEWDISDYPPEWIVALDPPPFDTLMFQPNESRVVTLMMEAVGTEHGAGMVHISEHLLPSSHTGACTTATCQDTTCGGYIRMTGGCSVTLLTVPTGVTGGEDTVTEASLVVYPSVFSQDARIGLFLPSGSTVNIAIYDVAGRRVRTVAHNSLGPGEHTFVWDGRNDRGRVVAPSCYFVRAETAGTFLTRKLVKAE